MGTEYQDRGVHVLTPRFGLTTVGPNDGDSTKALEQAYNASMSVLESVLSPFSNSTKGNLFFDDFNRPDQKGLGAAPSGQTWMLTGASAANAAIVSRRYVLNTGSAGGTVYAFAPLASAPMTVGGKFSFVPNGGASGTNVAIMFQGDTNNLLTKMIHLIVSRTGVTLTWWNGANQNNIPQYVSKVAYKSTLANDGTVYSVSMTVDGNWVYVYLPEGSVFVAYDPNFSIVYN